MEIQVVLIRAWFWDVVIVPFLQNVAVQSEPIKVLSKDEDTVPFLHTVATGAIVMGSVDLGLTAVEMGIGAAFVVSVVGFTVVVAVVVGFTVVVAVVVGFTVVFTVVVGA